MDIEDKPFAIVIPDVDSLSAPIAVATELSKLYIACMTKVEQLQEQTEVNTWRDPDGKTHIEINDHPDLKWWFEELRKIAKDIASITTNLQTKTVENKLKGLDIMFNSSNFPTEVREQLVKQFREAQEQI